jgi:zinc D-Ala-D-Ala carboxypeptidase
MPPVMLSPHFTLQEMTASQTASRMGIDNTPDAETVQCLRELANVLERVRSLLGDLPVLISSGYRCPELNEEVGGSDTSAHMSGYAADFTVPGFGDPRDVCLAIEPHMYTLGVDQLIYEYEGWVHLGLCAGVPRNQALTIDNSGTQVGIV